MKKLLFTTLAILACGATYALPVGNPSEASIMCDGVFCEGDCCTDLWDFWCDPCASWCDVFAFRVGFYGDYVFDRHMELENAGGADIEKTEVYTNAGYMALNLFNQLDIFATLGASNLMLTTNASAFGGAAGERLELATETKFSWSIGGRATLFECGCWSVGVEGQYFAFNPDIERVTRAATASVYPDDSISVDYKEWQVGLGMSYRINMFVPYVAVSWSRSKLSTDKELIDFATGTDVTLRDLESKKLWAYAVGVSLVDCDKAALTVEGRFAGEKAVYVNGQFRF